MKFILQVPNWLQGVILLKKLMASLSMMITFVIKRNFWKINVALLCTAYCIVTSMPNYLNFSEKALKESPSYQLILENYESLSRQAENPFQPQQVEVSSHSSKIAFRFIPTLLVHYVPATNLLTKMFSLYIINNVFGFLFFVGVLSLVFKFSNDKLFATLVACNFSVLYTGKSFFHDTYLWNDGIAFTFIVFSLLSRSSIIILLCLLAAYFTDERAIFSGLLALVYHKIVAADFKKPYPLLASSDWPYVLSFGVYFLIRLLLGYFLGLKTPSGDESGVALLIRFRDSSFTWTNILGFVLVYKFAWLLIFAPLKWMKQNRVILTVYCTGIVAIGVASFSVGDLTRSLSYGFVALLIGFVIFYKKCIQRLNYRRNFALFILLSANFFLPTISVVGIVVKLLPPIDKALVLVSKKSDMIAAYWW
ncbi:hypothetical protein GCM10027347_09360 [Larkinella harenae]